MPIKKELETSLIMPVTPSFIERRICLIRGQKVMLDSDLAELYQVPTKYLNQIVHRNIPRFPVDFMFQLNQEEAQSLRLQIATSNEGRGGRRYSPLVFTELGVAMLSSVLKSDRAVQMNIFIMRTFVELRMTLATHADLAKKVQELAEGQKEHTESLIIISTALNKLRNDHKRLEEEVDGAHRTLKPAIGFQVATKL
jgi:hypothetical protein